MDKELLILNTERIQILAYFHTILSVWFIKLKWTIRYCANQNGFSDWKRCLIYEMRQACNSLPQLSSHSMGQAANQISVLSSQDSIRPQHDWLWWVSESVQQREEANNSDSVETEVMETQSSLPPLFAIQSHPLSQNILLLSNQWSLPTGRWSHFSSLLLDFLSPTFYCY